MEETGAQKRASRKYKNSKYRPNVFIDTDKRESIERWFTGKGYRSFSEYVCDLFDQDMGVSADGIENDSVDHE